MYHSRLVSVLLVSLVFSLCTGAAIYPKSLTAQEGSNSDVSISALQTQDQSGSQDSWSKYVEFYGSSTIYQGVFTFDASTIDASSVGAYSLSVNFKGDTSADQLWKFEFFQPSTNTWIEAGDNSNAKSWSWTSLSLSGSTVEFASLVSNGEVQVRLTSTLGDDCDIDYLAIVTVASSSSTTGSQAPPTAAPATAAPTSAPATAAPATPAPSKHKSTKAPTSAPTSKPTKAPTSAPTSKPTKAPTSAPTPKATKAPTSAPATPAPSTTTGQSSGGGGVGPTSPSGRMCPTGTYWAPAPATTWQWQLTGTIDQSYDVQMYDIDLFDNTADTIASLHAAGRVVICYFSTQYENWRPDAASFTPAVIGHALDDWPGENYVDIRSPIVRAIMQERLDLAVSKGCDGVEPDNVDEYTNTNGLGITAADQLDFNQFIASEAHARGLSVGLKNDIDQAKDLVSYFDWALDEQCNQYSECSTLKPFITAGKAVFGTEYSGTASKFCPTMVADQMSWLLKDLNLDSKVTQCCTYAPGGCAVKAPHQCLSATPNAKRSIVENEVAIVDEVVAAVAEPVYEEFHSAATSTLPIVAVALVSAVVLLL